MRLYSDLIWRKRSILRNLFSINKLFPFYLTFFFLLSILMPLPVNAEGNPSLEVPGKVLKGDMFRATVENTPPGTLITWDWEEKNKLILIDLTDTSITFQAIGEGNVKITAFAGNWKQQGDVFIGKTDGRRKPVVIESPKEPVDPSKSVLAEQLFERFRSGEFSDPIDFFRAMGDKDLSMHDMFAMKKEIINRERLRLMEKNVAAEDALSQSEDYWAREFAPYERDLMEARQKGVEQVWANALREYRKKYPGRCFAEMIRMDVGGLGTSRDKLKFEGDIDLAVLILNNNKILLEDAIAFKGIFAAEVHNFFNLYMKALDAFATAHRAATGDVFIGEYGARWAEKAAMDSLNMKKVAEDGTLQPMSKEEVARTIAKLQNIDYKKKSGSDLIQTVQEEFTKPRSDMEPGIGLEFLRHINKDAIRTPMSHFEKILKIAKYAARSAGIARIGETPDPLFADSVKAIDAYRKDPNPDVRVDYVYNMFEYLLGKGWAGNLDESIQRFGDRAKRFITRLAEQGLKVRLDEIEKITDDEQKDAEKKKLFDDLMREYEEYEKGNMLEDFPKVMLDQMKSLSEHFKGKTTIPADQLKKMQEFMEKAVDNPNMMKIAVAAAWRWAETLGHGTDKALNFFNEYLDILDNRTIQKLREGGVLEFKALGDKAVLKSPPVITTINQRLNESILGTIGNTTLFKGFNFAMEINAYKDAIVSGATWRDSFTNLSVEYFRRHIPTGTAIEAYMYGNYLRTGVELVYIIFPPLAIPEGLYGMALTAVDWGVGKMNEWEYDKMVDALYRGATFEKSGVGKGWRMTGISYECPPIKIEFTIDKETKSQEGLYDLLNSCNRISAILYPQVKMHPVIMQYEEMLEKKEVSSGRAQIMGIGTGWPYKYLDLSKYGEELYKTYRKKIDAVTLEYFKGVIQGLEKRKGWDTGTGYSKIIEIEKELGCVKPLVEYSTGMFGDIKRDAKYFQEIVDQYRRLKDTNKTITVMKEDWKAGFLEGLKPDCSLKSIAETEKKAGELLGKLTQAVRESREYVEKVIDMEPKDEDLLPITKARLCMAYFVYMKGNSSAEYARCYEDYQQAKADVDQKANIVEADIAIARPEICVGEQVSPRVSYNKRCDDCSVKNWEIINENGDVEETLPDGTQTSWKPDIPGKKTIRARVEIDFVKGIVQFERKPEKKVTVQPEDKCPKLKVELDTGGVKKIAKDTSLTVTVKTVSLGPGSPVIHHYLWYEDKKQIKSTKSDEPNYQFSGANKAGKTVKVGVVAVDAHNNHSDTASVDIEVTLTTTEALAVSIVPEKGTDVTIKDDGSLTINDEGAVTLNAIVTPKKDSGKLLFRWSADKTSVFGGDEKTAHFEGKGWSGRKVKIDVTVMDKKNREGTASLIVNVLASTAIEVEFEDHPQTVSERDVLQLRVKEPRKETGNYRYTWKRNGAVVRDRMEPDYFDIPDFQGLAGKSVTFAVEVSDDKGRTGKVETMIKVTEPKPEDEKLKVSVKPESDTITQADTRNIICTATPLNDSGRLTFNGAQQSQGVTSITIPFSGKGHENLVPVACEVSDEKGRTGEAVARIFVKKKSEESKPEDKPSDKPTTGDPKKLAEEKYQWIKGIPDYLEALIELDKKTQNSAVKVIRKTVLAKAAAGQYPQCDTACQKRIEDIKKSIGDCGPYVVKESGTDPLTGEKILINVIKEDRPCSGADKAKSEEAARLSDPMSYEEFKCYEQVTKPFKEHQQDLKKKLSEVNESKVLKNFQEYAAWTMYKEYLQEIDALKSRLNLPDPIPSPPALPWAYSSSCGGAEGAPDQTKLSVTLKKTPEKATYNIGEIIKIYASVTGGKAPYTYSWTGEHEGKDETVSFASRKPGDHSLSVAVKDSSGKNGSASIKILIGGVEADIQGLPKSAVFGTTLPITVSIKDTVEREIKKEQEAGPKTRKWKTYEECAHVIREIEEKGGVFLPCPDQEDAFDENCKPVCVDDPDELITTTGYRTVWLSDTEGIEFNPSTSDNDKTQLVLSRMGKIKIWAQIQKSTGEGVYSTIGETEQKEITVIPPKFKWTFDPPEGQGMIGKEVKATITTDPPVNPDLIYYRWSYPESSNRMEYEKNAGVIGFIPKDPKPLMLLAAPEVPHYRDLIGGGLKEEYQAGAYTITVSKPRYLQSKPQIWKCDTQLGGGQKCGLVEVDYEFAVYHNIFMKADITPPPSETPRFEWTMIPEGCRLHNDITQEITFDCSKTGTYTATVTVRDKNDVVLGTGSGQVSITISQETLNGSKKKAEEAKKDQKDKEEAQKKLNLALEALREGKIDEAIRLAEEAAKIDKKLAEPVLKQIAQECKKLGWNSGIYERDFKKGIGLLEAAVRLNPADKEAEEKLNKAKKFEKIWPQVEQKAKEFDTLIAEKKVVTAYKKILEIQDLQFEMPGQMANQFSQNLMKTWNKANEEYNQFIQEAGRTHKEYFDAEDWDGMLAHVQEVLKRELTESTQKAWEGNLAFAKQKIGERNQAWDYYLGVKVVFEKGDFIQASEMLRDLKNKPQYFMKRDPRKQQIEDLIAAIEKAQKVVAAKGYAMNLFRAAEQVLRDYHYGQAAELLKDGLRAMHDNGDPNDPDYAKYYRLYEDCLAKDKRLKELLPGVQSAAMDEKPLPLETLQNALRGAEEMVSLQPSNTDSQIYKGRLEAKLKNVQNNKLKGEALWNEGKSLFNQNRHSDALTKFKESLKYLTTPEHTKYVQELEAKLNQNKEMAKKLRTEGEALQNQNRLKEAVAKYRESLKYLPDSKLEEHIKLIEAKIAETSNKKETADKLWQEGRSLYDQNKWSDALSKFKESLTYWSDPVRQDYVQKMETAKAAAKTLRDEGAALQQQGKLQDAVNKYKQSVKTWTNLSLEEHIIRVEDAIRNISEKKACAKKNRDEGAALQQQGRLQEALAKYRASYNCWPSPEMQEHIKKVERAIAAPTHTPDPPVSTSRNLTGKWTANCGDKESYEVTISHYGNTFDAEADREAYKGNIKGNVITGKSYGLRDTINGEIISDNEIRIQVTGYIGDTPFTNKCTLKRGSISTGQTPVNSNQQQGTVSVTLKNASAQNVHIYPKGETTSPDNRLSPGQSRQTTVAVSSDGFLNFCAGRNGKDIECKKQAADPGYSGYTYTVTFDDSNPFSQLLIKVGTR